jgi:hypothetical protein
MATPQVTANTGSPPMAETERRVARMPDRIFAVYFDAVVLLPGFVAAAALSAHWNHIPASGDGTLNLQGGPALEAMFLCILIVCVVLLLVGRVLQQDTRQRDDVRSRDGGTCGVGKAFLRNLLRPIDAIRLMQSGFIFLDFWLPSLHRKTCESVTESLEP